MMGRRLLCQGGGGREGLRWVIVTLRLIDATLSTTTDITQEAQYEVTSLATNRELGSIKLRNAFTTQKQNKTKLIYKYNPRPFCD